MTQPLDYENPSEAEWVDDELGEDKIPLITRDGGGCLLCLALPVVVFVIAFLAMFANLRLGPGD